MGTFIEINGLVSDIISDVNIRASASSLQSKVSQICQIIKNWKFENNVIDIGIASIIRDIAILIQKECNADEMSIQIVNTLYDKFSYIDIIRKQLNKDKDVLLKNDGLSNLLSAQEINNCFTLDYYFKNIDEIYKRCNVI